MSSSYNVLTIPNISVKITIGLSPKKEESFLKENAWDRAVRLAEYIVETKNTVRQTALVFGISKSTVHTGVTKWNGERDYMKNAMILHKNFVLTYWFTN